MTAIITKISQNALLSGPIKIMLHYEAIVKLTCIRQKIYILIS